MSSIGSALSNRATYDIHNVLTEVCRSPGRTNYKHPSLEVSKRIWNLLALEIERNLIHGTPVGIPKLCDFSFAMRDCATIGFPGRRIRNPSVSLSDNFIRMFNVDKTVMSSAGNEGVPMNFPVKPVTYASVLGELSRVGVKKDDIKYLVDDVVRYVGELTAPSSAPSRVVSLSLGFATIFFKGRAVFIQYTPHFITRCFEVDTCKWPQDTKEMVRRAAGIARLVNTMHEAALGCAMNPPGPCSCDPAPTVAEHLRATPTPSARSGYSGRPSSAGVSTGVCISEPFKPTDRIPRTFDNACKKQQQHNVQESHGRPCTAKQSQPQQRQRPSSAMRPGSAGSRPTTATSVATAGSIFDEVDEEGVYALVQQQQVAQKPRRPVRFIDRDTIIEQEDEMGTITAEPTPRPELDAPMPTAYPTSKPSQPQPTPTSTSQCDFMGDLQRDDTSAQRLQKERARQVLEYNKLQAEAKKRHEKEQLDAERCCAQRDADVENRVMQTRETTEAMRRREQSSALRTIWGQQTDIHSETQKIEKMKAQEGPNEHPFFEHRVNTPGTRRFL
eukprot:PhM_4_TR5183/c0_g1_i2/m.99100